MDNEDKNLNKDIESLDEPILDDSEIVNEEINDNVYTDVNTSNNQVSPQRNNFYNNRQNLNKLSSNYFDNRKPNINNKENTTSKNDNNKSISDNKILSNSPVNSGMNKINDAKNLLNAAEQAQEEGKSAAAAVVKGQAKAQIKKKIVSFIIANLPTILIVIGVIILVFILTVFIIAIVSDVTEEDNSNVNYKCSTISINTTSLSKDDFVSRVNASSTNATFKSYAGRIYDIAKSNNINPEMVVIRASVEGYSPGINYNYWGIRCYNGKNTCESYNSFDAGVLAYVNNIKQYSTVEEMVKKYAYIGKYWYNTSASNSENTGLGGCYYFPYIKQYMSEARAAIVEHACQNGNWCHKSGGGNCVPTIDEDQTAYAKWQVQRMVEVREKLFNISADACEEEGSDYEIEDDGTLGSQVATYAVDTFDSYSYSQDNRWGAGYVDCSSLVYRVYSHFGYKFGGVSTADLEYVWCLNNDKLISANELKAGDLIFFNQGIYSNSSKKYNIGHVSIYVGNGKHFAAHSSKKDQPDQVSVTNYNGNGTYFCRPYK